MNVALLLLYIIPVVLIVYSIQRADGTLRTGLTRAFEQFIILEELRRRHRHEQISPLEERVQLLTS